MFESSRLLSFSRSSNFFLFRITVFKDYNGLLILPVLAGVTQVLQTKFMNAQQPQQPHSTPQVDKEELVRRAWKIFLGEVTEEGLALMDDRTAAEASRRGILAALAEKGAQILPPGCGPCCGSSPGIPRNGWNVLSTANRNFIGRMGNVTSGIYLGSPASVAAAAVTGRICDARSLSDQGASHAI